MLIKYAGRQVNWVHFSVVCFIQVYSVAKCYLEVQTYKNIHVGFVTHNAVD